jgi:HD-GYP domain-containing protein (c-di-GMP phosphodiesterase class II)
MCPPREQAGAASLNESSTMDRPGERFSGRSIVPGRPASSPGRRTTADSEHATRSLAGALALAVDAKDHYTRGHCQAVSTLCGVIETELGFAPEEVSRIRLAGLLHDVGKIGIPDAILNKPAELTGEEYEQMKTHSALGHGIVLAANMPNEANWVLHHHERIDGAGYPDGLAGMDIPLESRVIHVADAFEAMTSDRPYRDGLGEGAAVEELRRNADTQFDSRIVAALLRVLGGRAEAGGRLKRRRLKRAIPGPASPGRDVVSRP